MVTTKSSTGLTEELPNRNTTQRTYSHGVKTKQTNRVIADVIIKLLSPNSSLSLNTRRKEGKENWMDNEKEAHEMCQHIKNEKMKHKVML